MKIQRRNGVERLGDIPRRRRIQADDERPRRGGESRLLQDRIDINVMRGKNRGQRGNDPESVMRNVARTMTDQEIEEVSLFYARKAGTPVQ